MFWGLVDGGITCFRDYWYLGIWYLEKEFALSRIPESLNFSTLMVPHRDVSLSTSVKNKCHQFLQYLILKQQWVLDSKTYSEWKHPINIKTSLQQQQQQNNFFFFFFFFFFFLNVTTLGNSFSVLVFSLLWFHYRV